MASWGHFVLTRGEQMIYIIEVDCPSSSVGRAKV